MKINGWKIEYWEETFQLLWRNRDVVANSYKESGRTQTLKKKKTGDHLWNLKQFVLGITGSVIPVVITESSEKERGNKLIVVHTEGKGEIWRRTFSKEWKLSMNREGIINSTFRLEEVSNVMKQSPTKKKLNILNASFGLNICFYLKDNGLELNWNKRKINFCIYKVFPQFLSISSFFCLSLDCI